MRIHINKRVTLMLIPHQAHSPWKISIPLGTLYAVGLAWIGVGVWALGVLSRHASYLATLQANLELSRKNHVFAQEVLKAREITDELKDLDGQLRALLDLKTRKAILENGGTGGPSKMDTRTLSLALEGKLGTLTEQELQAQTRLLRAEAEAAHRRYEDLSGYVREQRRILAATPATWPVVGRITSHFGYRISPFTRDSDFHQALDIACPRGTPVRASANGVVTLSHWEGGYGRLVVINHGYGYQTRYGHNSVLLVRPGERVRRGQVVALVGHTGSATGDHLHYEVWCRGRPVNPLRYVER